MGKLKTFWRSLGPGLIVGAADDDPAGITIYALAGAKFGLSILWTVLGTLPFMIIIQRMAGRIGLVSGKGLAANMKKHYPIWMLLAITLLISVANIINIGADISAMAAAINLLMPFPAILIAVALSLVIILLVVFLPYRIIAQYLKWVAISMFSYIIAAFLVTQPWKDILFHTVIPHVSLNREYVAMIVAIFGTTISPYLFFWQASEAVEESRQREHMIPDIEPHAKRKGAFIKNEIGAMYTDIRIGMIFSNLITFFIMILSASTLFGHGFGEFSTIGEVASLLKPLAGNYANLLFLIGILASGILAIPILAGSAAYAISEMVGWREGLDRDFRKAPQFYMVMIIATLLGIAIPLLGLQPVNILYITGVIFGFVSPFAILLVIHMANNPKIMGKFTSRHYSNVIAYGLFIAMATGLIVMAIR